MHAKTSILIADDDRTNLALMDMLVRKLPECATQLHAEPAALPVQLGGMAFDIAIVTHRMPAVNGIELVRHVRSHAHLAARPVLIVTAEQEPATRKLALEAGAAGVLHKPIDPVEFRTRIASLVRLSGGMLQPQAQPDWRWNTALAEGAGAPAADEELVSAFARAAGYKDCETPLHATRVACYCAILAHHLGLPDDACAELRLAAPLHDVGKAGLRDDLLQTRGLLAEEQRRHMMEHTRIGHAILSGGRSSVMRLAAEIALTHHERWDGLGYPMGLRGEQIPLPGRIAAVADVFDALTSVRSYKCAWTLNNAYDYLHENAGTQFDPRCVAAFQIGREEVAAVMSMLPDGAADWDADAA